MTTLGGNQDHTAGSTATIDSCRTGIFQNLDGLHVAHIESESRLLRNTIYHVQRTHAAQVTCAADKDLRSFTRSTASFRHAHTGCQTLQGLSDRLGRERLYILGAHRRDSTRHVGAFLRTIAHHNDIFQDLTILLKCHVIHCATVRHGNRLRLIADIGDHNLLARLNI